MGDAELLDQQAVFDLEDAYLFLRRVEHAIQALNDQQTQSLPSEPELRQRMIDTLGFSDWNSFLNVLNQKEIKSKFSLNNSFKRKSSLLP